MKAKKKYGQNFLIDKNIVSQILRLIDCENDDLIIEIGPGRGALTEHLTQTACKVLGIEIDNDMKVYLDSYESDNCHIIYQDILESDIKDILKDIEYKNVYVVGNLPYYITSPIIEMLIKSGIDIKKMVFMVQKEVADRYSAECKNKEYGYMTVFINHYYDVKSMINVPPRCFNPAPKVNSAVIQLQSKNCFFQSEDEKYWDFIKTAFKFKRKTLRNNLKNYDWSKIFNVLTNHNISENVRAEELNEIVLKEIYDVIIKD